MVLNFADTFIIAGLIRRICSNQAVQYNPGIFVTYTGFLPELNSL
jgi:hypothetical protein